jgi:hypothetical protein
MQESTVAVPIVGPKQFLSEVKAGLLDTGGFVLEWAREVHEQRGRGPAHGKAVLTLSPLLKAFNF